MFKSIEISLSILLFLFPTVSYGVAGWSEVDLDRSVVKIGTGCTGTRISNEGHILTARHCFNGCLISGGFVEVERLFPEHGWQSPKLYKLNQEATCATTVDGEATDISVLAIGPGFMTPMEQGSLSYLDSSLYEEFLEKSYLHNGDFAIVKEQVTSETSCRNVSWSKTNINEEVVFRGYPSRSTGRPDGRNSDGYSMLEGRGVVIASIFDNACVSENAQNYESLVMRYDREDLILSTVDNLPGGSGSALLNRGGEIIGVINSQYRQGIDVQSTYCSGSTVAIPMHHISKVLDESGHGDQVQNYFNCQ